MDSLLNTSGQLPNNHFLDAQVKFNFYFSTFNNLNMDTLLVLQTSSARKMN